jgi:hypothetical protein
MYRKVRHGPNLPINRTRGEALWNSAHGRPSATGLDGEGDKPKGMRWSTFERLHAEHNGFVNTSLAGMKRKFGGSGGELDDLLGDQ